MNKVNSLPSSMNLKWQIVEKAASSSLSKAEYLTSVFDNFLEKNDIKAHPPRSHCWRTPPIWESEASAAIETGAFGTGCMSTGTDIRADLEAEKDDNISGDQTNNFLEVFGPLRALVRGARIFAAFLINRL